MPYVFEFRTAKGTTEQVNTELAKWCTDGWEPISHTADHSQDHHGPRFWSVYRVTCIVRRPA